MDWVQSVAKFALGAVAIWFCYRLVSVYFSKESREYRRRFRSPENGLRMVNDVTLCHWCERTIDPPLRPCTAICDHKLDDLVSSHPDAVCRQMLKELDYPIYRKGDISDSPPA